MKYKLSALAMAVAMGVAGTTGAMAQMTKAEVEAIVHDYLMNNGDVILQSVNDYQTKGMAAEQAKALDANRDKLYKDDGVPTAGNENGDVTVVEFFDYNCGYCKRVVGDVNTLIKDDKNVKVVFFDYPILGPTSTTAAHWALASDKQGKYLEYHTALLENQGPLNEQVLEEKAKAVGLDVEKLKADADSEEVKAQIESNLELARSMNITGTPAFIIGDNVIPGAIPLESMKTSVQQVRDTYETE